MARGIRCLVVAALLVPAAVGALEQMPEGFTPLFNGRNLDGWIVENSDGSNFHVVDGVLRVEGPAGWLRSTEQYDDFELRAEFRFLTDDADSGLFMRAPGPASNVFIRGWPANAYQVQIRNMAVNRTTNPYWMGNLYRHRVAPGETAFDTAAAGQAYRGTEDWQDAVVVATGDRIEVSINGVATTVATGIVNPGGYVGVQGETGVVEYRTLVIRER